MSDDGVVVEKRGRGRPVKRIVRWIEFTVIHKQYKWNF